MNTAMVLQFGGKALSTVEEGADAILRLAASGDMEGRSGLYFNGQSEVTANAQVYDAAARLQLKTLSLALTGLSEKKPEIRGAIPPLKRCPCSGVGGERHARVTVLTCHCGCDTALPQ